MEQGANLYIKNLEETIDDTRLRKEFEYYGTITSAKVIRDDKGNSKGFGFVCFQSPEEATKAVTEKNGQIVLTKPLYVVKANNFNNQFQGANLYIKNLEETIDDTRLRKEFENYGTITSAKVMRDDKGNSKGFGFVCFQSREEATKAIKEKNGQIVLTRPLYVAFAQRKQERQAQLAAEHRQHVAGRMFTGGFYPAMATFSPGQRPPMFPTQVVRTRFPTQPVRGQAYPGPMMNRARMQRATGTRPVGQQQSRIVPAGASQQPPANAANSSADGSAIPDPLFLKIL